MNLQAVRIDNHGVTADRRKVAEQIDVLWRLLTELQKERFVHELCVEHYEKDEIIFHEGEAPTHLSYLLSGKVKISREGIGGRQQIVRMIRQGMIFGFRAYFIHENYMTSASANETCMVARLPLPYIQELVTENSSIALVIIRQLATGLGLADRTIVSLTQKHLRGRLAEALLRLLDNYGTMRDGQTLDIYMTREDLAQLSNMTTSNAIRTLSDFAKEGLIAIKGKNLCILDVQKLQRVSDIG